MFQPLCEALENRCLLFGWVSASVSDGTLILRGDTFDNSLVIDTEGLPAGSVRVEGLNTQVDGQQLPLVFSGVTQTILVSLGAGDDRLVVKNADLSADLRIAMGKGDDAVVLDSVDVGGALLVRTKRGADSVNFVNTTVAGGTRVSTGSNADVLAVDSSTFNGKVLLKTRGGRDSIALDGSAFNGQTRIQGGFSQDLISREIQTISYNFANGDEGWQAGFADYDANANAFDENGTPVYNNAEEYFELESGIRPLPAELNNPSTGFYLRGFNHSDDLFMFLKRRIGAAEGVRGGQQYQGIFSLTLASNAPTGSGGPGGSPGESVYLKAGVGPDEPDRLLTSGDDWRMTVDKGNQSSSGPAASTAGNVANGNAVTGGGNPQFRSFTRAHVHMARVSTSVSGDLWILVGTDSGYEDATSIYYQRIEIRLVSIIS